MDPAQTDRPAILVDPNELAAAEAGSEAEVSVDLSPGFAAALEAQNRHKLREAPLRATLLRVSLSDETRKERRNLLAASVVTLAVVWVGLVPDQASLGGVQFDLGSSERLLWLLFWIVVYFLGVFVVYALSDVALGRTRGLVALGTHRSSSTDTKSNGQVQAEEAAFRLTRVLVKRRAERELQRSIVRWTTVGSATTAVLALIDFVLPLGAAGWALWELVAALS